ncbi:hypothetical protein [Sphingomonas lycopersici]|uniref:Uncharacterized protein n=1 Tax=Sphingomonas lycopersici TaxID=2951807 RepID=A0AA42CS66_9SPHN|nr:hypothetical protein [Sphingomonas lycopersici]MCW6536974.1 hypothetical protein [Sphingomonas lycopersici]
MAPLNPPGLTRLFFRLRFRRREFLVDAGTAIGAHAGVALLNDAFERPDHAGVNHPSRRDR